MVEIAERTYTPQRVVTTTEALRALVGEPSERAKGKQIDHLDPHARAFIAHSPYLLLGTSDKAGRCDVSPKGDAPGFVLVLDDHTVVVPDRPGNKRVDSLMNVLENPRVGLLFLIPGMSETLRLNGTAQIVQDEALLERIAVGGKVPQLGIVVHVEEVFMHCGKASLRSHLWEPEHFMSREQMPSLAQIIQDQMRPPGRSDEEHAKIVAETLESHQQAYACLY
jgi:PPOX class probable FMN-dependent enzyme